MSTFKLIKHNNGVVPYENDDMVALSKLDEGQIIQCIIPSKKRTITANRALHLFFTQLASAMNDLGMTFEYKGLKGEKMETPWTETLVKEMVWRKIQIALFGIESTTKLESKMIDKILNVLSKFFAERGVNIVFPNKIDMLIKMYGDE